MESQSSDRISASNARPSTACSESQNIASSGKRCKSPSRLLEAPYSAHVSFPSSHHTSASRASNLTHCSHTTDFRSPLVNLACEVQPCLSQGATRASDHPSACCFKSTRSSLCFLSEAFQPLTFPLRASVSCSPTGLSISVCNVPHFATHAPYAELPSCVPSDINT